MGYMFRRKWQLLLVAVFVVISAGASVAGTYFLKPILNEGIVPLIGKDVTPEDLVPFAKMVSMVAGIYLCGTLCTFGYSRLMIYVSNGTLNAVRKDLFNSMEDLPIRYFDRCV